MSVFFHQLRHGFRRPGLLLLGLLALGLTLGGAPSGVSAQANRPLSGCGCISLLVQATSANISGSRVYINNAVTNGASGAILLVTQNWNPNGQGGTYNNHPVGVWYDPSVREWTIFNEDGAAMPVGASFNVIGQFGVGAWQGGLFYSHIAANASSDFSDLSDNLSINNPNAVVFVTETSTVDGAPMGCNCLHPLGVWYNTSTGHWSVFNEDTTPMSSTEAFNVLVFSSVMHGISTLTSTSTTVAGDSVNLPNLGLTTSLVFVTPNWNPPGQSATYHNHTIGVWFNAGVGQWAIFNEDLATMPVGVSFNVLIL